MEELVKENGAVIDAELSEPKPEETIAALESEIRGLKRKLAGQSSSAGKHVFSALNGFSLNPSQLREVIAASEILAPALSKRKGGR